MSTLADLLPARVRAWVYALLLPVNAGVIAAVAAGDPPQWVLISTAVVNAAGFSLARANTSKA